LYRKHKLFAERMRQCLTQKQLAELAGLSAGTVGHIERRRGPDVPRSRRSSTKTRVATCVHLLVALGILEDGEYTVDELVACQDMFTEAEIYEAVENILARQRKREARRRAASTQRHLKLVV
jgi:transcriptional regulator with XRE-family HTH domain